MRLPELLRLVSLSQWQGTADPHPCTGPSNTYISLISKEISKIHYNKQVFPVNRVKAAASEALTITSATSHAASEALTITCAAVAEATTCSAEVPGKETETLSFNGRCVKEFMEMF